MTASRSSAARRAGSLSASMAVMRPSRIVKASTATGRPASVATKPAAPSMIAGCVARWVESVAYRNATLLTTVSPGLVQRLDRHPEANGKARLLLNGVDVDRFQPDTAPSAARAALGWPEAALTLVYVGSVGLAQGVDTLIAAVEPLAEAGVVLRWLDEHVVDLVDRLGHQEQTTTE